jgi:hypothetical protein
VIHRCYVGKRDEESIFFTFGQLCRFFFFLAKSFLLLLLLFFFYFFVYFGCVEDILITCLNKFVFTGNWSVSYKGHMERAYSFSM